MASVLLYTLQVICLLALGGSQMSADNDTSVTIEGYEFGEVKTVVQTDAGSVYHMAEDLWLPDNILYSDMKGLKRLITSTSQVAPLVGSDASCLDKCVGYKEGIALDARFNYMTSFIQVNKTTTITVDHVNHCLRAIYMVHLQTYLFVGECGYSGSRDGLSARFNFPWGVVKDERQVDHLIVSDKIGSVLRQVNMNTRETTTIKVTGIQIPTYLAFDFANENLMISNSYFIAELEANGSSLVNKVGSFSSFADGTFNDTQFILPEQAIALSDEITLVADFGANRIRVVSYANKNVTSICTGELNTTDGSAFSCALNRPQSLLAKNGTLYIGQDSSIRSLPFQLIQLEENRNDLDNASLVNVTNSTDTPTTQQCPENFTAAIGSGETTASVNWETPYGVNVTMSLEEGSFSFVYSLTDGSECEFVVTVVGPSIEAEKTNGTTYDCPMDMQATIGENDTVAMVKWTSPDGSNVTKNLREGVFNFLYEEYDCDFSITVTAIEKPLECPEKDVRYYLADSATKLAGVTFDHMFGRAHQVYFPIGLYNYSYNSEAGKSLCQYQIKVIDFNKKMRVDVVAEYNLKCNSQMTTSLKTAAGYMTAEIHEVCAGACELSINDSAKVECKDNVTKITWPTDLILPGMTEEVPEDFMTNALAKLKNKHLLKVLLYNQIPPIIFPTVNGAGLTADVILQPVCSQDRFFLEDTQTCVQNPSLAP